jgi:hypothetical protein
MSSAQETKINLLPPSEFELSFWGRFLKWAVTTGRYVIIVTELVVIVAFLSRFKLDSDLSGLTDEIRGKKNILDAQTAIEKRFLGIQSRLLFAENIMGQTLGADQEIDAIVKTIPDGIKIVDLNVGKSSDVISVNTVGDIDLGIMLSQMSKMGRWKSVDVSGLTVDSLKGVGLSVNLKRK